MGARPLLALVGPTASGKTDVAVEAALACGRPVEILGLDSRQLYRGLDIGTGKPTAEQRRQVPHSCMDLIDPVETFDAGRYRRLVEERLPPLWEEGRVPLLVGGAGFYLRALREGFFDLPDDPGRLRALRQEHAELGVDALRLRLREIDPEAAARIHPNDRYRLERSLELWALSGERPSALQRSFRPHPVAGATLEILHLSPARALLHERIDRRTADWLDRGWVEEVRRLLAAGVPESAPGLGILGYRDVLEVALGRATCEEIRERVIVQTRQYARQQETWFRKLPAIWRGEGGTEAGEALRAALERVGDLDTGQGRC